MSTETVEPFTIPVLVPDGAPRQQYVEKMMPPLTVGDLRAAAADLPDDAPAFVTVPSGWDLPLEWACATQQIPPDRAMAGDWVVGEPQVWGLEMHAADVPVDWEDPVDAIRRAAAELKRAEGNLRRVVAVQRARGLSYAKVGEGLGVSRQAAWERFHVVGERAS